MSQNVDAATTFIWVFNGDGETRSFPGGVFSTFEKAVKWIAEYRLSGVLTAYPLDEGAYDWAKRRDVLDEGRATPTPDHVGRFSTAHQPHHHFVEGKQEA